MSKVETLDGNQRPNFSQKEKEGKWEAVSLLRKNTLGLFLPASYHDPSLLCVSLFCILYLVSHLLIV